LIRRVFSRRARVLALVLTCFAAGSAAADAHLGSLFGKPPQAQPAGPDPDLAAIAAELDALAKRPDAAVAAGAIEQGRVAVATAATLAPRDAAAAQRAKQIAWAALSLASRRIAAAEGARAAADADRRAEAAEAERARAADALNDARARLAALRAEAEAAR
jgi:hypothetical protein